MCTCIVERGNLSLTSDLVENSQINIRSNIKKKKLTNHLTENRSPQSNNYFYKNHWSDHKPHSQSLLSATGEKLIGHKQIKTQN